MIYINVFITPAGKEIIGEAQDCEDDAAVEAAKKTYPLPLCDVNNLPKYVGTICRQKGDVDFFNLQKCIIHHHTLITKRIRKAIEYSG